MAFRILETIDGAGFLELRMAWQTLRRIRPKSRPDRVWLIPDAAGTVAIYEEGSTISGMRLTFETMLAAAEARFLLANAGSSKSLHTVNIPLIERAAIEFRTKHRFDLFEYRITVVDDGPMRVVILAQKDRAEGKIATAGKPTFEVGFDRETLEMVKSHFSR